MPRGLEELLDATDPAWPHVSELLASASNPVRILPRDEANAAETLYFLQVTTHSTLGAVAWETGGMMVDDGWLRLLGSGSRELANDLRAWNDATSPLHVPGALIVAHDAVGGVFALNSSAFAGEFGNVWYFAPDTLRWGDLGRGYTAFIEWVCTGDLETFYHDTRWPTWRKDAAMLNGDYGFSNYPLLWTEGPAIALRSRQAIPMTELWLVQREFATRLHGERE